MIVGSFRLQHGRALAAAVLAVLVLATAASAVPQDRDTHSGAVESLRVIVQKRSAADLAPERAVQRLGGRVTNALPIIAGFAATVPVTVAGELARLPGVRAVTPDGRVHVQGAASASNIRSVYPKVVKAETAWQRGVTGRGVTVAVVDTGVANNLPDLNGRLVPVTNDVTGRIEPCKNLSGELNCNDSYGHGTFIAGLIAGNGAGSGGTWKGVAPEANILSVKTAGANGAADVSNILAAIQWVVSFKDRYNIRVLNLSLGTDSTQPWQIDPFNYAVERAWAAGITVVVAASNRGPGPGSISKPADDPWVITVGATDDRGTTSLSDDLLPDFSGRGPATQGVAKPDIAAPGAHVVSLRHHRQPVPVVRRRDLPAGQRHVHGHRGGCGLGRADAPGQPGLHPRPGEVCADRDGQGRRLRRPDGCRGRGGGRQRGRLLAVPRPRRRSDGRLGSLALSRGSVQVQADNLLGSILGSLLGATLTAQVLLWNPGGYTGAAWVPSDWYLSTWEVYRWYRVGWYGNDWPGSRWHDASSYGQPQQESYGSSLPGSAWYGAWE